MIRSSQRGFTLLETIIALAILSVALVAIAGINTGALDNHHYARQLTIATLLARSKMADLESKLQSDGFSSDDTTEHGNFDDEGYPQFTWEAEIIRPQTEDLDVASLLNQAGSAIGSFLPAAPSTAGGSAPGAPGSPGAAGALLTGPLGSMVQGQLQQMLTALSQQVREVRLAVKWQQGTQTEQLRVVTHVLSLGQGTDKAISTDPPPTPVTNPPGGSVR